MTATPLISGGPVTIQPAEVGHEDEWWAMHHADFPPHDDRSEIFTCDHDPTRAQSLEVLSEVRGQWSIDDRLLTVMPALELRQCHVPLSDGARWHGPDIEPRPTPATVRTIPAVSGLGVGTIQIRVRGQRRRHAAAGFGVEVITAHECKRNCVCSWPFYLPFRVFWHVPAVTDLEASMLAQGDWPNRLLEILWETVPAPAGEWFKGRKVHWYDRVEQAAAFAVGDRYVKLWECVFRKGAESSNEDETGVPGKIGARIAIHKDYTLVKFDPTPEFVRHRDSADEVMNYLDVSRATAFRYMRDGFKIPRPEHVFEPWTVRQTIVAAGGGYMQLRPAVRPIPQGSTETSPRCSAPERFTPPAPKPWNGYQGDGIPVSMRARDYVVFYGPPLPPCDCEQCQAERVPTLR